MNTFVPLTTMFGSAEVLDRQRLGKQRVECLQMLRALSGETKGWVNHPATKMWKGHEHALATYGVSVCVAWIARGYQDTCRGKILDLVQQHGDSWGEGLPGWWGDARVHTSHRSNLLRKAPEHYRLYWPYERDDLPYYWPTDEETNP